MASTKRIMQPASAADSGSKPDSSPDIEGSELKKKSKLGARGRPMYPPSQPGGESAGHQRRKRAAR